MLKAIVLMLAVLLSLMLAPASAPAIPDGLVLTFPGGTAGQVTFDGTLHTQKGFHCDICHTSGLFQTRKGGDKMSMAVMREGKFCGFCHNGKKGFAMGDNANCKRCHRKK